MPRQITLDRIKASGVNIYKEDGVLRIEANYHVLSGNEVIKTVSRDITSALSSEEKTATSNTYDAIFSQIEGLELS